jgi:hypothetical protein
MTEYTAHCYTDRSDTITATHDSQAVWLEPSGPAVGLETDAARRFARGILALADEIDGGEAPVADEPLKVGDRVVVTDSDFGASGETFTLDRIDTHDEDLPYRVTDAAGQAWWVNGVEKITDEPTLDTSEASLQVGDRVVVVKDDFGSRVGEFVGRVGTLKSVNSTNRLPYRVVFGTGTGFHGDPDNGSWYCAEVRRVNDEPTVTVSGPSEEPLKVGDRVEITTYRNSHYGYEYTGLKGVLREIDTDGLPYLVDTDVEGRRWAAGVRKVTDEPTTDTSSSSSSVADPRRLAALKEAQQLIRDGLQNVSPLALARFLLAE